jgi:hypothetical protein
MPYRSGCDWPIEGLRVPHFEATTKSAPKCVVREAHFGPDKAGAVATAFVATIHVDGKSWSHTPRPWHPE